MDKKVVLVSGSSSGIGSSIIEKYASNDYNCVINYVSHEKEAIYLKKKLEEKYNIECLCIKADISSEEDVLNMFNEVKNKFNRLDVLVNNAGIALDTIIEKKNKKEFMKTLEVNLFGTYNMSKVFGKYMFEQGFGNILNISSTNGIDTYYEFSIDYDASKAGIINLSHNLANIFAPCVRVNTICPGWVDTPMNQELSDEFKEEENSKILLNRFASPSEIASLVYFLSSDEASYINDSVIRIDGGKKC